MDEAPNMISTLIILLSDTDSATVSVIFHLSYCLLPFFLYKTSSFILYIIHYRLWIIICWMLQDIIQNSISSWCCWNDNNWFWLTKECIHRSNVECKCLFFFSVWWKSSNDNLIIYLRILSVNELDRGFDQAPVYISTPAFIFNLFCYIIVFPPFFIKLIWWLIMIFL